MHVPSERETRPKLLAVFLAAVTALSMVAPFVLFGGVAAAANTSSSSLSVAANGAKIPTNHNWTVTVDGGVSGDVAEINLDYSGINTDFQNVGPEDIQVLVGGSSAGRVQSAMSYDSGESMVIFFESGGELSLSGGETVEVKMVNQPVTNPPTGGTYPPTIELKDSGGTVLASTTESLGITSGIISGSVYNDSDNTDDIQGADVEILRNGMPIAFAKTNSNGDYSIEIGPGTYDVKADATDYLSKTKSKTVSDGGTTTADFALAEASTVTGTVRDESQSGLANKWVVAYDRDANTDEAVTQTSGSGSYSLSVSEGSYDIIAFDQTNTYETSFTLDVIVSKGETVTQDLTMSQTPPNGTLSGTVVDSDGNPVSKAKVEAIPSTFSSPVETETDGSGQFSVEAPEGTYEVAASASGYANDSKRGVQVTGNSQTDVALSLSQPAYIEGHVDNDTGAVPNVFVVAESANGTHFDQADTNGDYKLTVTPGEEYRVTVFAQNQSGGSQIVSPSTGSSVTADFTLQKTEITHASVDVLDPAAQSNNIGLSARVGQGMLLVKLLNKTRPNPGKPEELSGLGVDRDTEFVINLTVTNYDPGTLLWGARNVSWETADNETNPDATDVSIRTKAVDLQGIEQRGLPIGPLMTQRPSDVPWPSGRNDRADLGWNETVFFGLFDMSTAPAALKERFSGMTVTTNAQTFAPPRLKDGSLEVWVAGPHRTVDGNTHSGFYEAKIPDSQLQSWGVDPANAESELQVMYQGQEQNFQVTDLADGVRIYLDIHYSAGTVEVSPSASAGSSTPSVTSTSGTQVSVSSSASDGTATAAVDNVEVGQPVVIPSDGVGAGGVQVGETTVSFDMGTSVDNEISVSASAGPPAGVSDPPETQVMSYVTVDIRGNLEGRDAGGTISFSVDEDRLADLEATADDVQAYHYDDATGEWEAIPTRQVDGTNFEATTDSFSTFAVGTSGASAATDTSTPTQTPTMTQTPSDETDDGTATATLAPTPTETGTLASTEPGDTETPGSSGPGFGPLLAIGALLALAGALVRRR